MIREARRHFDTSSLNLDLRSDQEFPFKHSKDCERKLGRCHEIYQLLAQEPTITHQSDRLSVDQGCYLNLIADDEVLFAHSNERKKAKSRAELIMNMKLNLPINVKYKWKGEKHPLQMACELDGISDMEPLSNRKVENVLMCARNVPKQFHTKELKRQANCLSVRRIYKQRKNGRRGATKVVTLMYKKGTAPSKITIGHKLCKLQVYKKYTPRCYRCQRYGHKAKGCNEPAKYKRCGNHPNRYCSSVGKQLSGRADCAPKQDDTLTKKRVIDEKHLHCPSEARQPATSEDNFQCPVEKQLPSPSNEPVKCKRCCGDHPTRDCSRVGKQLSGRADCAPKQDDTLAKKRAIDEKHLHCLSEARQPATGEDNFHCPVDKQLPCPSNEPEKIQMENGGGVETGMKYEKTSRMMFIKNIIKTEVVGGVLKIISRMSQGLSHVIKSGMKTLFNVFSLTG